MKKIKNSIVFFSSFTSSKVCNCLSSNNFCKKSSSTRSPMVNHCVSSNESSICETARILKKKQNSHVFNWKLNYEMKKSFYI